MSTLNIPDSRAYESLPALTPIETYFKLRCGSQEWGRLNAELNWFASGNSVFDPYEGNISVNYSYPPSWSGIMPVSLYGEPIGNVTLTLGQIGEACAASAGYGEVTLWVNTESKSDVITDDEQVALINDACGQYDLLIEKLQDCNFNSYLMGVRAILKFLPPPDPRAGQLGRFWNLLRADKTAAVCHDAWQRQFPKDHVIVWIDADTTYIDAKGFGNLTELSLPGRALFARAILELTDDGRDAITGQERELSRLPFRTDAEKVAAVYSGARLALETNPKLKPTDPRGYVDESSLAFTRETYFLSGGVSILDPTQGESRSLLARAREAQADGRLDPDIPLLIYVDEARMGTSDRRFRRLIAGGIPAWKLPDSVEGDDYVDASSMNMAGVRLRTAPVTESEVWRMVFRQVELQMGRTRTGLTQEQAREIGAMVRACAFAA
jgi:hypothetical protein